MDWKTTLALKIVLWVAEQLLKMDGHEDWAKDVHNWATSISVKSA